MRLQEHPKVQSSSWKRKNHHKRLDYQLSRTETKVSYLPKKKTKKLSNFMSRVPWRRYALDPNDQAADDSPTEDDEVVSSDDEVQCLTTTNNITEISDADDDDDRYNVKSDYGSSALTNINYNQPSGSDTEDEIERVLQRKKKLEVTIDDDIFNKTTDEDQPPSSSTNRSNSPISPLPTFFKGKKFYLSRNLSSIEEIKLKRFITVYCGQLTRNAAEADYIISNKAKELDANFRGEVVRPLWVFECNDLECLLPTIRYTFVM